jgi:hypothetical protein
MSIKILREVVARRKEYEAEKVFDYDIGDYDNWSADWYDTEEGQKCQSCYGTGMDKYEDADCMVCFGEGFLC